MLAGILAIRHMHMRAVAETGLTAADEMLYPENWRYLSDILSYVAVGARSVENQQHRLTVSGIDIPAGMKNPTSGDLSVMLNSVVAAQHGHDFIFRGWEVQTDGNPLLTLFCAVPLINMEKQFRTITMKIFIVCTKCIRKEICLIQHVLLMLITPTLERDIWSRSVS